MESQVKQLKINARNIESFLSKSNKTLRKHKQDQKKFNIRQTTIQKQKVKESKIESVRSPIRKSSNAIGGVMKKGAKGIFGVLGSIMDFFTAIVLGNLVTNIENLGNWFKGKGITINSIFKGVTDFATMAADWGTKLLATAVPLPEELPEVSKEKPKNNKVKPLTNDNGGKSDTTKIDKNSLSEKLFPTSEKKSAQEGSDIINKMFGHEPELISSATNELSSLFAMNEASDASKLITSSFSGDPILGLFNSELNEEVVDHVLVMTQKIIVG